MTENRLDLSGILADIGQLRYSPAGVPIVEFRLLHSSEQQEGGISRKVECEIACLGVNETATKIARLQNGTQAKMRGFLAQRNRKSAQIVFHTEYFELIG